VAVQADTPELVVGGLNTLFDSSEVYTGSDESVVAGGGTVELKMTIAAKDAAELGDEGTNLSVSAGSGSLYLAVELEKNVLPTGSQETSTTLTEVPQLLDVYIPMEGAAQDFRVLRVHNGATDEITETPNEYGEYFEIAGSSVLLHVRRFSLYAIVRPATSDGSSYTITATAGPGGTVTPEKVSVPGGGTLTVKITPAEEHQVDTVTVDGVPVKSSGTYTFNNVYRNHTLTATFLCPSEAYADLDTESWYHAAVDFMINRGYMVGTSAERWSPDGVMTRAQMAAILARVRGADTARPTKISFRDVDISAWYAGPVAWASANGVGLGYGGDRFGPNDTLTREQLALMLYRFSGKPAAADGNLSEFFDQSHVSVWAKDAVRWAVGAGLLQGDDHRLLRPQGKCTRAETAAILYRMLKDSE
jgi:hypothetical protein